MKARTIISLVVTGVTCVAVACSGDVSFFGENHTSGTGGSRSGTGASTSSSGGGAQSSHTASSSGASQGGGGTGGGVACPHVAGHDPIAAGDPSCCTDGPAHCIPATDIADSIRPTLSPCTPKGGGAGLCVPDAQIEAGSDYMSVPCASIGGADGRCLSKCIHAVNSDPNVGLLMRGSCAGADELCVPCINPLTQKPTGACAPPSCKPGGTGGTGGGGGDGGAVCPYTGPPLIDPTTLDMCSPACSGAHCVPATAVPAAQQALLASCTAMGAPGFCTPDPFIESGGNLIPPTCTSVAGAEGRCASECVPAVAAQKEILPLANCASGERCVPCTDPRTGKDTGICHISCDPGPKGPPVILTCPWTGPAVVDPASLPACMPACGGAHCMPAYAIPAAQQAGLTACDVGGGVAGFCLEDKIISAGGDFKPKGCSPFTGTPAEGRCLSKCLGSVAAQASQLHQDVCDSDELCVPCYDPTSGAATGACSLSSCDMPVLPAYTFPTCCNYMGTPGGTCVPKDIVPSSQSGNLKQDTCPSNNFLCVPDEYLPTAPAGSVKTCTSLLPPGAGTCVSNCVNGAIGTQNSCPANHVCVACSLAPKGTPGCP